MTSTVVIEGAATGMALRESAVRETLGRREIERAVTEDVAPAPPVHGHLSQVRRNRVRIGRAVSMGRHPMNAHSTNHRSTNIMPRSN